MDGGEYPYGWDIAQSGDQTDLTSTQDRSAAWIPRHVQSLHHNIFLERYLVWALV